MMMERKKSITRGLFLFIFIGLKLCNVHAASCIIPRGELYRRSVYRPRYGPNTRNYPQSRRVRSGTKIVIICKDDINYDVVTDFSFSRCNNRKWVPALPQCKTKKRCRAPPAVQDATASEPITPYITFPHGTTVKYICDSDVDKMATGNDTVVCNDGQWSATNFRCTVIERECTIPIGSQYRRSVYRPQNGTSTQNYQTGSTISSGTKIVAICNTDVYGDIVRNWTFSECQNGEWIPVLRSCKVKKRCSAPPEIQHATVTKTLAPHITFPHGSTVTYMCDVGNMATGSDTIDCDDGHWTDTDFQCKESTDATTPISPVTRKSDVSCLSLFIEHGTIYVKDLHYGIYVVTCDAGFKLKSVQSYRCRGGRWVGRDPECKQVLRQCKFSSDARKRSQLKLTKSGEVINSMYADHGTRAVQTCTVKSRGKNRRTIKCVNGSWRPGLLTTCRLPRRRNRKLRTYSSCTIPTVKGLPARYDDVISGKEDVFQTGDEIVHGQIIERVCLQGFMILPVRQFNTSMVIVCDNGDLEPNIQRCLRSERDTFIFDNITTMETTTQTTTSVKETTTQTTTVASPQTTSDVSHQTTTTVSRDETTFVVTSSPSSSTASSTQTVTTKKPDIEYRIHIRARKGTQPPTYIVLDGALSKGIKLSLDSAEGSDGFHTVKALNVGEIERILSSSLNDPVDVNVEFVSIYNPGTEGFYIKRYHEQDPTGPQELEGKLCKRDFGEDLEMQLSLVVGDQSYSPTESEIDCKLRCIEENYNCRFAYYHKRYEACYVLKEGALNRSKHLSPDDSLRDDLSFFKREDTCS